MTDFPVYRKMTGFNRWFKIESNDVFIEVSMLGKLKKTQRIEAKQYPEKLRIMDMLNCEPPFEEFILEDKSFFN